MSDPERGPYTPPSDRLSFDPRQPVRSGGPAPVTLIISGVVLLAIIGGVFLLYRGGVRHKGDAPATVGAPLAQIKIPAPTDANAMPPRLTVNEVNASSGNTAFAPPPEQPLPRPLPVQATTATALPPPAPAGAAPTAALRPAAKPVTIASLTDDAMAQKPAVKPAPKPAGKPPTITPPASDTSAAAAPASGGGWVQIGAFSSSALAEKGWEDVAQLAPAAMAGKGRKVEAVARDGKTLYRAYVTGFAGHDAAQAFCDKLKASGKACFVK